MCGGLVHPIAGRCKHCRGDLRGRRAGRAAAPAQLPPLAQGADHPVVAIMGREPVAMLPARSEVHLDAPRSAWRRWPTLVIAFALVALALAAAALAWPVDNDHHGAAQAAPPTAQPVPDPLNKEPAPPQSVDPWGSATPPPVQPPAPAPDVHLPPPADPGSNALADPFALPQLGSALGAPTGRDFLTQFGRRLCDRLAACGTSNPTLDSYCSLWRAMPAPSQATSCPAARRCLDHVDHLRCSTPADDVGALNELLTQLPDCFEAVTNC